MRRRLYTSERAPGALNWGRFAADVTSPLSRVDRDERHAVLRAAVASLPENDRVIIILRHFDGMGNSACAAALGIDQRVYSTYETGRREIPAHHAVALAAFYKTSTDYLFGRTDQSKPYPRK